MWFFGAVLRRLSFLIKNDQTYIKWEFFFAMHKFPNLENPKTFNEKLQWLKLHNKHEYFTALVDKHAAKEYVKGIIGEEYIIPTIGIWEKFEDIDFSELPNKFVLKCTHDSGGLIICKDKCKLDIDNAKRKIS